MIIALMIAVPAISYVSWFFSNTWPPVETVVTVDGKTGGASAQKSRDGRYLRIEYPDGLYVVDLETPRLGRPSRTAHKVLFGHFHPEEGYFGVLVAKDYVKTEHDPHLLIEQGKVSFIDMDDRRIEVTY